MDFLSIKSICINLKRREDRLEKFTKTCPIENVETFYAIDGKTVKDDTNNVHFLEKFKKLNGGQIGCFLSHYYLWKKMLDENLDKLLILEDDCIFPSNFNNRFHKLLSEINIVENNGEVINIVYVGGRHWNNFTSRRNRIIKLNEFIYKYDQNMIQNWKPGGKNVKDCSGEIIVANDLDRTTSAYILSKKGAEILINKFNSLNSSNPAHKMPVDHFMLNTFKDIEEPIHHSKPLLIRNPPPHTKDSDIR